MAQQVATKPQQVYELFIKAPPERVWQGITDPEFTSQYFFGTRVRSTLEPGTPYVFTMGDDPGPIVEGDVVEADPPRRLVHTWRALYDPDLASDEPSRVTWELEPQEGGVTKLTVTHDEFDGETATYRSVAGGWSLVLSGLKTLLETGQALQSS